MIGTAENILNIPGPEVSDQIFEGHQEAIFWVGQVATKGVVSQPEYYDALTIFRAETYLELGFISTDHVDEYGREIDVDEKRSTSIAVVKKEQTGETGTAHIEGSGRLIFKESPDKPLPIETLFPEVFQDEPLPIDAVEASRFIARDPNKKTRHMINLSIIRALTYSSVEANVSSLYCVVERPLLSLFKHIGIPLKVLGDPKDVPGQGGVLYPVYVNYELIPESVRKDISGTIDLQAFFKDAKKGIGYYAEDLNGEDL